MTIGEAAWRCVQIDLAVSGTRDVLPRIARPLRRGRCSRERDRGTHKDDGSDDPFVHVLPRGRILSLRARWRGASSSARGRRSLARLLSSQRDSRLYTRTMRHPGRAIVGLAAAAAGFALRNRTARPTAVPVAY